MPSYLGPIGGLVKVKAPSSLRVPVVRPSTSSATLGGARKVQVSPRTSRAWDVGLSAATTSDDIAAVSALIEGEHGFGPWWWVDSWAQVTNVVPARGSVLDVGVPQGGTAVGGRVALPDGSLAGRHLIVEEESTLIYLPRIDSALEFLPVVPGMPVTASAWLRGSAARVRVRFYAPDRSTIITTTSGAVVDTLGAWVRCSENIIAPGGAAAMLIMVDGVSGITRPAVTWTNQLMPWHTGQSAAKSIVTNLDQSVTLALDEPGRQFAATSFTVQEVG